LDNHKVWLRGLERNISFRDNIIKKKLFEVSRKSSDDKYRKEEERTIREIYETINEISIAQQLLLNPNCINIEYELPIINCNRTIDFLIKINNKKIYCDVKTIHVERKDDYEVDWKKYKRTVAEKYLTGHIHLNKNELGGMIWHSMVSSRSKMLNYSCELEEKFQFVEKVPKAMCVMIFCGNGFDWVEDELEDFADYYKTGHHRSDDYFSKMEEHDMIQKGIQLKRNIDDFWYFERKFDQTKPEKFFINIHGPRDWFY
jgi:hypothetical protein